MEVKKMRSILVAVTILTAGFVGAQAQKAPNILTVDIEEVYNNYKKAQEAQEKFAIEVQNARDELNKILQEGVKMGEALQDLEEKANNPALTEKARKGFEEEARVKTEEIQKKQMEISQFQRETDQTLSDRRQAFVNLHMSEIRDSLAMLAKKKGADMVLNSSGVMVMYADCSFDVTQDAINMMNEDDKK